MKKPYSLLFLILIFASCVTQHTVELLQDKNKQVKDFSSAEFLDYTVKPNDELYIQISSLDEASTNIYSNSTSQLNGSITPYGASLMSYTIDKEGYLTISVIGKINVKDKTISQVSETIKAALSNVLNQPVVITKLVNRYVTILGEVRNPGHYPYAQDKLSVYDAIGLAGDITEYANRSQIILLRNENNTTHRINLDLSKSIILTSDYYFLRPNDIIYVKPLPNKFWGMRQFPFAIILSTISTAVLIIALIKN